MWTRPAGSSALLQHLQCGVEGSSRLLGPPAGMGSLREERFGTGQAGVMLWLGRGTWSCTEAAWGERISSVSTSLASATSQFVCL